MMKIFTEVQYPQAKATYRFFNEETYEMQLENCEIRPNKDLAKKARVETPWSVEVGVFSKYLAETKPSLIKKCFEFDWENMKPIRLKKSSMDDIKEEMRKVYGYIKEFYRV